MEMVKLKRDEERSSNEDVLMVPSNAATDMTLLEEDWVVVKKQRVNILIPPLPGSCDSVPRELDTFALDHPAEKCSEEQLVAGNDKPSSAAMENAPVTASIPDPSDGVVPVVNLGKVTPRKWSNSEQAAPQKQDDVPKALKRTPAQPGLRVIKQPRLLNDGPALFSKMMKASNLERKLLRAGGLSRWLTSLGLEQFIRIFRGRKISKFQLVNLSMSKLKDMGIQPVGPRRKLIHAIECVCHPYCFETL